MLYPWSKMKKTRSPSYVRQLRDFVWRPHQKSGDPSCCWMDPMGSTVIPTPNKNTSNLHTHMTTIDPSPMSSEKHVLIWYVYVFFWNPSSLSWMFTSSTFGTWYYGTIPHFTPRLWYGEHFYSPVVRQPRTVWSVCLLLYPCEISI